MPLAFFCTLFFRHRKKSVSAPWDGQSLSAPESARQSPSKGNFLRQSCLLMKQCRGLSARPLYPFGSPPAAIERPLGLQALLPRRRRRVRPHRGQRYAPAGAPKGFPRGKQSARPALPCAPLVVCLNSGSLTAFGGCIHWIPASLRSPLETFGPYSARKPMGKQPDRKRMGFPQDKQSGTP